jgi:hypothetical protein
MTQRESGYANHITHYPSTPPHTSNAHDPGNVRRLLITATHAPIAVTLTVAVTFGGIRAATPHPGLLNCRRSERGICSDVAQPKCQRAGEHVFPELARHTRQKAQPAESQIRPSNHGKRLK